MTNELLAKRKREEEKAKKESMDKGISNYFTKGPVVAQPKAKVSQPPSFASASTKNYHSLLRQKQTTTSWRISLVKSTPMCLVLFYNQQEDEKLKTNERPAPCLPPSKKPSDTWPRKQNCSIAGHPRRHLLSKIMVMMGS